MKSNILIIMLSCFANILNAQTLFAPEAASSLKELGIKGPVKEIVQYSWSANYGDEDTVRSRWKTVFEFGQRGNLLSETKYTPKGRTISKSLYDYTKQDTVIISQFDYNSQPANKVVLKYDNERKLIGADELSPQFDIVVFKRTFKYDLHGNEIERKLYSPNGDLDWTEITYYDNKGQKTAMESEGSYSHSMDSKTAYKYDKSGYLAKEETTDKGDSLPTIEVKYAKYDKYGNWLMKVQVHDPGKKATAFLTKTLTNANLKVTDRDLINKDITTREIKYF